MSARVEILKRRASSGRPGWDDAVKELCSMTQDRVLFSMFILPSLLDHLSQHRPPHLTAHEPAQVPPDTVLLALTVLEALPVGLCIDQDESMLHHPSVQATLRGSWSSLHSWLSFFVDTYIVPRIRSVQFSDSFESRSLTVILSLYATFISTKAIRPQELSMTPGAQETIIRIQICGLAVDSSFYLDQHASVPEFVYHSALITQAVVDDPDTWLDITSNTLDNMGNTLAPVLVPVLARLVMRPKMNYIVLCDWIFVLAHAASRSVKFDQCVLQYRAVHFITGLLCRLSKRVLRQPELLREDDYFETWMNCMMFLDHSFELGGQDTIIMSLKSGFLPALWRLSIASDSLDPPLESELFAPSWVYRRSLGRIAAFSLFRSVQRVLTRIMRKHEFNTVFDGAETDSMVTRTAVIPPALTHSKPFWEKFKETVNARVNLGAAWENRKSRILCSDLKCSSLMKASDLRLCTRCRAASYCDQSCQRSHWQDGHREECQSHAANQASGVPRNPDQLDILCAQDILSIQLWALRDELLKTQEMYRREHAFDTSTILVSRVDFIATSMDIKHDVVWTLEEAKNKNPTFTQWIGLSRILQRLQAANVVAGPIVAAFIPHPMNPRFCPMVLRNPRKAWAEPEYLLADEPEDEMVECHSRRPPGVPSMMNHYILY